MMPQTSLMTISLVLITTCLVAQVRKDDSKSENRPQIVGTWELVSTEERLTDGSKRPYSDVGPRGQGYLMYTADGHMCAAGMNPDRQSWKDVNTPTELEKLRAIDGFFGYCGRYEIDALNHAIYHYPEVALDPNYVGTKQIRPYRFDSGILTFSDKDTTPGVDSYVISWKKMPSTDPASALDDPTAWITEYEHNAAAADLAGDVSFYQKNLADDWSDGMSDGQFQTKHDLISDLTDREHNITFRETLSDIKVRVYGDTAVATYKEMYDALIGGKRIAKTIITTDTFTKISGQWKLIAAHSSAVRHP